MLTTPELTSLPTDILRLILQRLGVQDLLISRLVCKQFNTVVLDPLTWNIAKNIKPIAYQKFRKITSKVNAASQNFGVVEYTQVVTDLEELVRLTNLPPAEIKEMRATLGEIKEQIVERVSSENAPNDASSRGFILGCLNFTLGFLCLGTMCLFIYLFEHEIDCNFIKDQEAFIKKVTKELIWGTFSTATLGIFMGFLFKCGDYIFGCTAANQEAYYQRTLPPADLVIGSQTSHETTRDKLIKVLYYRDQIALVLSVLFVLLLLVRDPFDINNDDCIKYLNDKIASCFQNCVDPKEKNTYIREKNREIFHYTFFIGFFLAFSFVSNITKLSQGAVKLACVSFRAVKNITFFKSADNSPNNVESINLLPDLKKQYEPFDSL